MVRYDTVLLSNQLVNISRSVPYNTNMRQKTCNCQIIKKAFLNLIIFSIQ